MKVVYRNDQSFCGPISTLKKLDNGDFVLVFREALWRGDSTHTDPTTRTSMLRSNDGGETWHTQVTPDGTGGQGVSINQLSDGNLIVNNFHFKIFPPSKRGDFDGKDVTEKVGLDSTTATSVLKNDPQARLVDPWGWIAILDGIYITRSNDRGYTWECERKIETPTIAPSTAGRIIELEDRTLLMPIQGPNLPISESEVVWILNSDDKGVNWTVRGIVAEINDPNLLPFGETRLVQMQSGRILLGARSGGANFFTSYSDDEAKTWSKIEETPIFCNGSSPFDLLLLADGRVLATYGHRREPWGVRACISEDEGETWDIDNEIVLRDDGLDRDMGYPSSQQLDDGSILTVYYWHHEDQIRHLVSQKWTVD